MSEQQTAEPERGIKAFHAQFMAFCDQLGSSRELSLAKTKMDEAAFWLREHLRVKQ
jgi:hypothetical protein